MPDIKIIEVVVSLGVPGLALGVFYLLYKKLNVKIPIRKRYAGPIIVLFILTVTAIVPTALYLFRPFSPLSIPDKAAP